MKLIIDNTNTVKSKVLENIRSKEGAAVSVFFAIHNCESLGEASIALDELCATKLIERIEIQSPPGRYDVRRCIVFYRYAGLTRTASLHAVS